MGQEWGGLSSGGAGREGDEVSIETREVLAACYLGPNKRRGRMLSHAVVVDRDKRVVEVLCRRVSELSIADREASDPTATPTCAYCLRALKKRRATHLDGP